MNISKNIFVELLLISLANNKASNTLCVVVRTSWSRDQSRLSYMVYGIFDYMYISHLIPYFLYLNLLQSMIQNILNLICFVIDFFKDF